MDSRRCRVFTYEKRGFSAKLKRTAGDLSRSRVIVRTTETVERGSTRCVQSLLAGATSMPHAVDVLELDCDVLVPAAVENQLAGTNR